MKQCNTLNNYYPFGLPEAGRSWSYEGNITEYTGSNPAELEITKYKDYTYGFNGMKKDDYIKGKGKSLDFGARQYDPEICRFTTLDPMKEKYPGISPYVAFANNPIMFIDPDGEKYLNFNKSTGKFLGPSDDNWWHNLTYGTIGRLWNDHGELIKEFNFSDVSSDAKQIIDKKITKLVIVGDEQIRYLAKKSGAFDPANKTENRSIEDRYGYILVEGQMKGKMDISYSRSLQLLYPEATAEPFKEGSPLIFLVGNTAYNQMNFGNFMTGVSAQAMGFYLPEIQGGAHVFTLLYGRSVYGWRIPQLDATDDQQAIMDGFLYGRQHFYDKISEKSDTSTSDSQNTSDEEERR